MLNNRRTKSVILPLGMHGELPSMFNGRVCSNQIRRWTLNTGLRQDWFQDVFSSLSFVLELLRLDWLQFVLG